MSLDTLFGLANAFVLVGWIALLLRPGWGVTQRLAGVIIPGLLAMAYVLLLTSVVQSGLPEEAGFSSLAAVEALFGQAQGAGALAAWLHYLAFDLFVGAWEGRDSRAIGLPRWLLVPSLLLTFMAGPLGLLVYLIGRTLWSRGVPRP
ncbi:hypothetical protein PB2503_06687 [Parvularcula bermudensis HTCC2503]|uniref:Uncharacterized protein n=1 Tax=Parvularcula bermudensis (strain ATCC BAA-594 / HTCC2503 / KCTC 12087) TaxID=314260 RepID=E0TI64_PARBH|nr:ABA4-like family protein [Parvularcula bermudensis]ADM09403.1 hypothetical protein PB2503_06687 [Parvularcula bermudensis HTCC2503]